MGPMEAFRVIDQCLAELHVLRKRRDPDKKAYTQEEVEAKKIIFDAMVKEARHDS